MAVRQLKDYYKRIEEMFIELNDDLKEMEEDFKAGKITEDELRNLLLPVSGLKENYIRLSYVMYLLNQPNRPKKEQRYHNQNATLNGFFQEQGVTKDQDLEDCKNALDEFKKNLKELKESKIDG